MRTQEIQKITTHIPKQLLFEAQAVTGKGITETVKAGLEKLALAKVYDRFEKLEGSYQFSINLKELRQDRDPK